MNHLHTEIYAGGWNIKKMREGNGMIKNIKIEGLKCLDKEELEFNNLTLLAGKNSVGKSTVIQAILAMEQEGNNPFCGPYMNIGKINELKNKYVGSKEIHIVINDQFSKTMLDDKTPAQCVGKLSDELNVRYLSADRIGVRDTYEMTMDHGSEIGVRCEYAYQYLVLHDADKWEESELVYDNQSKLTFGGQVDYWLDRILGYTIKAEEIERTELIRVSFGTRGLGNNIRPKNVGTGVSYIAEIIIGALSCKVGDALIIENPEIHLHPSGQSDFMLFLCFLAEKGIQIIVETHSDHIYNAVRKYICEDVIDCDNTTVYFFEKRKDGTGLPVKILIDENGKPNQSRDGFFDQTKKDLDVILGW